VCEYINLCDVSVKQVNYLVLPCVHCVPKYDIHIDHMSKSLHLITRRSSYRNAYVMVSKTPTTCFTGWIYIRTCYVFSEQYVGVLFSLYVLGHDTYSLSAPILEQLVNRNIVIFSFFIRIGIHGYTGPEVVTAEQQSAPLPFFLCD
jgi:hypothetical protein